MLGGHATGVLGEKMKKVIILILLITNGILNANEMYKIKNGNLFKSDDTYIFIDDYDYVESILNGKNIGYIARLEESWDYTFYFFDKDGNQLTSFDIGNSYEYPSINFSPDEKFFVLEDGTWIIRSIELFSYPSFSKISEVTYKRLYFWIDKYLYYNAISDEQIKGFPRDDDKYCYLCRINPYTQKKETIIKWNDCNQYEVKSYNNGTIKIENMYVDNIDDWHYYDKWKYRELTIYVTDCSFKSAFINDDLVRFRKEPSLSGEKISNFKKNDEIIVLSRTKEMYSVEGTKNYWYQVQDNQGIIGYVFGEYVTIKK